ncbi:MAG: SDR family oxidoreductase [Candidatus Nanopelagicaceae bacterium]|jgi:NAD(P)-dependent dehydrogenase (short-subunit alcohol dehydrogenase family)
MTATNGFKGKSIIVTGAGSGIGRAAAIQFAMQGGKVLIADLNEATANVVAEEIRAAGGVAVTVVGDLSDQVIVDRVVTTAIEQFGTIDVLVNNAGIMDSMSANDEVTTKEWDRVIRVNLTAPFMLSRAALPHMLKVGKGAIVNTASEAAIRGSAAGTAYTVSKHGIVGLTKSDAVMYRNRGIRVNAVAPGGTRTNIQVVPVEGTEGPKILGGYMSNVGRIADADEVAAAILFLASDAASDINGAILPVDGGWSAV